VDRFAEFEDELKELEELRSTMSDISFSARQMRTTPTALSSMATSSLALSSMAMSSMATARFGDLVMSMEDTHL
jgi:hypothetical protein